MSHVRTNHVRDRLNVSVANGFRMGLRRSRGQSRFWGLIAKSRLPPRRLPGSVVRRHRAETSRRFSGLVWTVNVLSAIGKRVADLTLRPRACRKRFAVVRTEVFSGSAETGYFVS